MTNNILKNKRILVIEDMEVNMRLFHAMLRLDEVEVLSAERAIKGIEIARRELPDLILMDINMPEMDGLEATRILRADPVTAHIPIIAVTASVMNDDKHEVFDAGCDDCISKPISPSEFSAALKEFFHQRSQPTL